MDDFDHADLDGDGEFDAIDIDIMEDGEHGKSSAPRGSSGCCVVFLVVSASVGFGWWVVGSYFV